MLDSGRWSFGRVVLLSVVWVAFVVVATVAGVYLSVRYQAASTGSGGIGAVMGGPGVLAVVLTILFGPPLVLILTWLYRSRSK
jgi:hypothetical protein